MQRLGIDMDELMICQPDHGEQAFNVMDELVRSNAMDLIVVDSVSALVPRSEVEGDIGVLQVGAGWRGGQCAGGAGLLAWLDGDERVCAASLPWAVSSHSREPLGCWVELPFFGADRVGRTP